MQVSCNPTYSGTHEILVKYLRDRFNVEVTLVGRSIDEYRKAIRSNTKVRPNYAIRYYRTSLESFH